jgi:hypothetical protein
MMLCQVLLLDSVDRSSEAYNQRRAKLNSRIDSRPGGVLEFVCYGPQFARDKTALNVPGQSIALPDETSAGLEIERL